MSSGQSHKWHPSALWDLGWATTQISKLRLPRGHWGLHVPQHLPRKCDCTLTCEMIPDPEPDSPETLLPKTVVSGHVELKLGFIAYGKSRCQSSSFLLSRKIEWLSVEHFAVRSTAEMCMANTMGYLKAPQGAPSLTSQWPGTWDRSAPGLPALLPGPAAARAEWTTTEASVGARGPSPGLGAATVQGGELLPPWSPGSHQTVQRCPQDCGFPSPM